MASATAGVAESQQHPSAAAALADANLWATASGCCGWTGRSSWGLGFGGLVKWNAPCMTFGLVLEVP